MRPLLCKEQCLDSLEHSRVTALRPNFNPPKPLISQGLCSLHAFKQCIAGQFAAVTGQSVPQHCLSCGVLAVPHRATVWAAHQDNQVD